MIKKILYHIRNFYFRIFVRISPSGRYEKIFGFTDLPGSKLKSYFSLRSHRNNQALCNAPFKSMYLGIDGYVYPCCFNREIKLGNFNSQPFAEIWNGDVVKQFRNELMGYCFPEGCTPCKERFLSENFEGMGARDYDIIPFRKDQPSEIIFELSDDCNYRCIMCRGSDFDWLEKYKGNTNVKDFNIPFINEQFETILSKLHKVKFLGGEPFYIDVYYSLWEKIISANPDCIIEVQTNGSILDDRVKAILEKGRFRIGVSLDSLDEETYKNIRRGGNLRNVIANIDYFHHYVLRKKTRLFFSFCPMTLNWKEIPAIVDFCNSYNAHLFFNTVKTPKAISLFHISAKKLEPILESHKNSRLSSGNYIELINKKRYSEFIGELDKIYQQLVLTAIAKKEEMDLISKTSVTELIAKLNGRYNDYINKADIQNNIFVKFESITDKLIELYPQDIYFKKLLIFIFELPKEKFEKVFRNDFHKEFFTRFSYEYSQSKSIGIEN